MKRLLIVSVAAVLASSAPAKAEGPDEAYIEVYKLLQDGDQLSASGQAQSAQAKYREAQTELKKLHAAYPNWNQKLVEYRLLLLESKVEAAGTGTPAPPAASTSTPTPAPTPGRTTLQQAPAGTATVTPVQPALAPAPAMLPVESDDRDHQIKGLQEQTKALQERAARLQNDKSVLEAKLREALAARPAAVDPAELARAEERIRTVEKEKAVLKVSLQVAESKLSQRLEASSAETKKALAEAQQKLAQQSEAIAALTQEKTVLQSRLQSALPANEEALRNLRAENAALQTQLAGKAPSAQPQRVDDQAGKELAATKSALQSSREMVSSLQVRLRALEQERDRLEKTRHDLETRLASAPAPAAPSANESAQLKQVRKERDELQKKLAETERHLTENKAKGRQAVAQRPAEDVSALRARLDVLEARKVPYSPEELALFQKPEEVSSVVKLSTPEKPGHELPADATQLLAEAQRAHTSGRFEEAEKKYLEVLRYDDKNIGTLDRLAAAQLAQGRPKDAEATLRRALEQNANDARSLLLMGEAKFDQDKYDEALEYLSRSAQIDPQNSETQNYLGITLSQKGQRAAAETALRKAIQISPTYNSAHYNLAVVYATQQPPFTELARWHYQKALAYGHRPNPDLERMMERKPAASAQK